MKRFGYCKSCVIFVLAAIVVRTTVLSTFELPALRLAHDIDFSALSIMKPTADSYSLIHGNITLLNEKRETMVIPYMYYAHHIQQAVNNEQASLLIVGVLSASFNQDRRISIRDTWGLNVKNRLFFLVSGESLTPEMQQEMEQYHDLFFVQQPESYRWGLTPKSLAFFHAMAAGSIPFQHLLKTDDDSHVHIDRLQAWLSKGQGQPHYAGVCFARSPIVRESTGLYSRYYVSQELYPNRTVYPPYASGAGYVISRKATKCLLRSMDRVPYLPSEDANTGRLLYDFCDAPCTFDERFNVNFNMSNADVAFLQHYVDANMMRRYHDFVTKPELQWTSELFFNGNATLVDEEQHAMRIPYTFHEEKMQFLRRIDTLGRFGSRLIVAIMSHASNTEQRRAIRKIHRENHVDANDTSIFFLVASKSSDLVLLNEFLEHRDLFVVLNQTETFANVTLKLLTFFQAVHQHVSHQPYWIVKADDDSFANIPRIRSEMQAQKGDYIGRCQEGGTIERSAGSKYYVPESLLPAHTHFPAQYATGFGYLLSHKAVSCLAQHSATTPYLTVEDANTGWILKEYCQILCAPSQHFKYHGSGPIDENAAVQSPVSLEELEQLASQSPRILKRDVDLSTTLSIKPATVDYSLIHGNITLLNEDRMTIVIPYMYYAGHMQQTIDSEHALSLIVGVLSTNSNQKRRMSIRNTWGADVPNRLFFLVSGENLSAEMQQEMEQYHDLFFVQQPETYRWGLTPKSLSFFHAMVTGIIPFRHLFKTDDDTYVHVGRLQAWLSKTNPRYAGLCFVGQPIVRQSTGALARYYVSHELYPNLTVYPPYGSGAGYALSHDASKCLSQNMDRVSYLPSEDANTGRMLRDFCEVLCTSDSRFNWDFNNRNVDIAFQQHKVDEHMMKQYHDLATKPRLR